jgi:hypothetical protein
MNLTVTMIAKSDEISLTVGSTMLKLNNMMPNISIKVANKTSSDLASIHFNLLEFTSQNFSWEIVRSAKSYIGELLKYGQFFGARKLSDWFAFRDEQRSPESFNRMSELACMRVLVTEFSHK